MTRKGYFLIILHIFSVKWCKSGVNSEWFWCTEWCKTKNVSRNLFFTIPLCIKLLNLIPHTLVIIYNPVKYTIQLCNIPQLKSFCEEHKATVGIHRIILQHSMFQHIFFLCFQSLYSLLALMNFKNSACCTCVSASLL